MDKRIHDMNTWERTINKFYDAQGKLIDRPWYYFFHFIERYKLLKEIDRLGRKIEGYKRKYTPYRDFHVFTEDSERCPICKATVCLAELHPIVYP